MLACTRSLSSQAMRPPCKRRSRGRTATDKKVWRWPGRPRRRPFWDSRAKRRTFHAGPSLPPRRTTSRKRRGVRRGAGAARCRHWPVRHGANFDGEGALARAQSSVADAQRAGAGALRRHTHARPLAEDIEKRFPRDAFITTIWLPVTAAASALERGDPEGAVEVLQPAARYEAGAAFWPQYVRGMAYLKANRAVEAVGEFKGSSTTVDKRRSRCSTPSLTSAWPGRHPWQATARRHRTHMRPCCASGWTPTRTCLP